MSEPTFKVDTEKARHKVHAIREISTACGRRVARWSAETVYFIKRYANAQFSKGKNRRTGHLLRNIGMAVVESEGVTRAEIGTGVGGAANVIYARIQDKGGTIQAKGKKLTVPFPGVLGPAEVYKANSFLLKTAKGCYIVQKKTGKRGGLRFLFTLRSSVTLPGSGWFSTPMEYRTDILRGQTMDAVKILDEAFDIAGAEK